MPEIEANCEEHLDASVVIPVYNGETTIVACIESVLKQTYPKDKYEVIVVDNNSADGTVELLGKYSDHLTRYSESKPGVAAARNRGIASARGKSIAFIDADCVAHQDWLANLIRPLRNDTIGMVGGQIRTTHPDNPIERFGDSIHDHARAITELDIPYVVGMNAAARREVLQKVGLFDEQYIRFQDGELSLRMSGLGYEFFYVPDAIVYHENETSLPGLFKEGCTHGYYSIKGHKQYSRYLKECGHRRNRFNSFRALFHELRSYVTGCDRRTSTYRIVFEAGKSVGKIGGSIRYCYFDV